MQSVVVDANVMNCFQRERIEGIEGDACIALCTITSNDYIVLDDAGHCQAEWIECAGGKPPLALQDWIADMLVKEKIRLIELTQDSRHKELTKLGIPKKDHKWVRLALCAGSRIIVTEDIDLFDPTRKSNCSSSTRNRIKQNRSGPVVRYLRKTHGIEVICIQHVSEYF